LKTASQEYLATSTLELRLIEQVIDAMLASDSIHDFCRALVHSDIAGDKAQGSEVYTLDNASRLTMVAGYGLSIHELDQQLTAWSEGPIPESIRSKHLALASFPEASKSLLAIPLINDRIPVGVLAIYLDGNVAISPIDQNIATIIGKIGAFFLETSGIHNGNTKKVLSQGSPEDLTSRQLTILSAMADGLVNAEIARELLLSESTIRQETVKIYRALGVANRQEAAKKGKALGLIAKNATMPMQAAMATAERVVS